MEISRNQMEASAKMTAKALPIQSGDNALVCLNTSYIAGKMMLVRGMVCELNMYVIEPSSNPLSEIPDDLRIDFIAVVPLQLEAMINSEELGGNQLNQMKAIMVGGAPVSHKLAERIKELSCPVYSTFGMTETVSHIALKRLNGSEASDYFRVLDNVQIGQDNRSCLTINSILTNNQTIITNDIVNLIDNRTFEWLGRADLMINSGGIKIHPEQLEYQIKSLLSKQNIHHDLIVAGVPDQSFGERIVLILQVSEILPNTLEFINSTLKNNLSAYHYPKNIYSLPKFVYTPTGKIKRKETIRLISS